MTKPIIFYDGQCPLCQREIQHYQRTQGAGELEFVDLTQAEDRLKPYAITLKSALLKLHAVDAQGVIKVGVDAFILIWRHLKGWRWLARFVNIPGIKQLAVLSYHWFAKWRFIKNGYSEKCDTHCERKF